jgi:type I restriction enzyme S subunit
MAMKKGYKQTEVGLIPLEWDVKPFGEVAIFRNGLNFVKSDRGDIVKVVGVGDFQSNFRIKYDHLDTVQISGSLGSDDLLKGGDLLFVRSNGNKALIGRCILISELSEPVSFSGFTIRARALTTFAESEYVGRYFQSNRAKQQIKESGEGSHISNLSQQVLASLKLPLPPFAEQEAIAGALSDADAWIESLEQLIAKNRQIKQGAMQELLTGKRRLPGFSGKWETKRLGDHCQFLRNGTNSRAELTVEESLKYLHYGDIHSCNSVHICPKSLPSLLKAKANTLDRLQDGDIVLADASEDTVGISKSVEIVETDGLELVAGLHTIAVRFTAGTFAPRFAGYLQHCPDFNSHLRKLAAGTKVYATNRRHVSSAEVSIPSLKEQTAIANVLSDMDAEIESLESKLAKAREIKQGMMQELLTGRIRLV